MLVLTQDMHLCTRDKTNTENGMWKLNASHNLAPATRMDCRSCSSVSPPTDTPDSTSASDWYVDMCACASLCVCARVKD